MSQGVLYTEDDIKRLTQDRRFMAAVHAYSMDLFPLGDAMFHAVTERPYAPPSIDIGAYTQLFQEIAERIEAGRIQIPEGLERDFPEIYADSRQRPHALLGLRYGPRRLMFSELRNPDVKKKELELYRRTYDEDDIQAFIKDDRVLAAFDAYGKNILNFFKVKEILFGDVNAAPRDLSFVAFQKLGIEVVHRIKSGVLQLPERLEERFPNIYHPSSP